MATFYRKNKISQTFPVNLNGAVFQVSLRKMTTTEYMNFASIGAKVDRSIRSRDIQIPTTDELQDMALAVCSLVTEIHDLNDEDDNEIKWADLSDNERFDLFNQCDFTTISQLFVDAGRVGGLNEQEKKL